MAKLKIKLLTRMELFYSNNVRLIPNLFKGDLEVKIYVFISWLGNNITNLNPFNRYLQNLILNFRIIYSRFFHKVQLVSKQQSFQLKDLDVVYINLQHRNDRNIESLAEFKKLNLSKPMRFNAIYEKNGALGCTLSHKGVLEQWTPNQQRLLMICEDDVSFMGNIDNLSILLTAFFNDNCLDVLCLGFNHFNEASYNYLFKLTSNTINTGCYVIKPHMREKMLANFSLSAKLFSYGIDNMYKVAIDQVWTSLQKKYFFCIPNIRFAYQRESYSDIGKGIYKGDKVSNPNF